MTKFYYAVGHDPEFGAYFLICPADYWDNFRCLYDDWVELPAAIEEHFEELEEGTYLFTGSSTEEGIALLEDHGFIRNDDLAG